MNLIEAYETCHLCPRSCGVNRHNGRGNDRLGFCGETDQLRVAYVGPHFGEEPPISGERGSGTVFFTGCSLKCSFCQNYQISRDRMGKPMGLDELQKEIGEMIQRHHVHNLNFVTPDHFFPHLFSLVSLLRGKGLNLPMVYNLSGFQSVEMIRIAEDFVDIYLPDFKYSDSSLAGRLSKCPDYPKKAIEAIAEMVRQKDLLDSCSKDAGPAKKGVLVRHLILPGKVENSVNALTSLFLEFGPELPLSLMSQYHPAVQQKDPDLNRSITSEEFYRVYSHGKELGFENLFVQFPEEKTRTSPDASPFLPDFRQPEPFR